MLKCSKKTSKDCPFILCKTCCSGCDIHDSDGQCRDCNQKIKKGCPGKRCGACCKGCVVHDQKFKGRDCVQCSTQAAKDCPYQMCGACCDGDDQCPVHGFETDSDDDSSNDGPEECKKCNQNGQIRMSKRSLW